MIDRIFFSLMLAAGLFSCKSFSVQEQVIVSEANQNISDMQAYQNNQIRSIVNSTRKLIEDNGYKPKEVIVLKQLKEIKNTSDEAMQGIMLLEKNQVNPDSLNKKIKFLYDHLNDNEKSKINLPDLSSGSSEINQKIKSLQLMNLEYKLVESLSGEIGGVDDIRCGTISILVSEASKVVEEGSTYSAEVFPAVALNSLSNEYKITFDDTTISYNANRATIKYKPKARIDESDSLSQKFWTGSLTFKDRGKDSTLAIKGEYWIRKCK